MATREQMLAARRQAGTGRTQYAPTTNRYQPSTRTAAPPSTTGGGQGGVYIEGVGYVYDPDLINAYTALQQMGFSAANSAMILQENTRQFDATMAWNREQADSALAAARMDLQASLASSGADREARIAAAQMQLEAAQYAADKAYAASELDSQTKLKIAQMDNETQQRYIEAQIAAKGPAGWTERAYWMRGQQPSAATPAATPAAAPAAAPAAQPQAAWQSYLGGNAQPQVASQAIVGEQGPEIATATRYGTQYTPIDTPAKAKLATQKRLTQMATGGIVAPNRPRGGISRSILSAQGAGAGYTPAVSEMGLWGGTGSWRQKTSPLQKARAQGAPWATTYTGATAAATPAAGSAATPAAGGATAQGAAAATDTPANTDYQNMPWLKYIQEGTKPAGFGAWGGSQTSKLGYDIKPPHTMNLNHFLQLNPDEQQMALAAWQDVYGYTPETAFELMRRAAPLGSGTALAGYR